MSSTSNIVVAFDLYGTLLSTASVADKLSAHFGKDKGPELAATWRKYQLEYTWRLNSMSNNTRSPSTRTSNSPAPHLTPS